MQKSEVIKRIKTVINELLSPGTDEITVTLAEQPIETYLENNIELSLRTLFKDVPVSLIQPYTIKWASVSEHEAGVVYFGSSYDMSSVTVSSFSGQGVVQVVQISNYNSDTYDQSSNYMIEGVLFKTTSAGNMEINADGDTIPVESGDVFLFFNDRFYKVFLDPADFNLDFLLCFAAPDGDSGYFKNVTLSDTTFLPDVSDGNAYSEEENKTAATYGFTLSTWDKSSSGDYVSFYVPKEFCRLSSMKFASWETNKPKTIFNTDTLYRIQKNEYTKAGYVKPVVAVVKETGNLYSLEVYSRKDASDTLSEGYMVQVVPVQFIQDDLIEHFCYLVAFNYLSSIGNNGAELALQKYQKKIAEL